MDPGLNPKMGSKRVVHARAKGKHTRAVDFSACPALAISVMGQDKSLLILAKTAMERDEKKKSNELKFGSRQVLIRG